MSCSPSTVSLHRIRLLQAKAEAQVAIRWPQAAAHKLHAIRTKVPRVMILDLLRLMCAFAGGVPVALPRRGSLRESSDVAVNSEIGFHIRLLLATPLRIRRHLGASKQVYPVAARDRNQKFRLSGRK